VVLALYVFSANGCDKETPEKVASRPSPSEESVLNQLSGLRFEKVANVIVARPEKPAIQENNTLILKAQKVFTSGDGQVFLKNHAEGEEGPVGWQYLIIHGGSAEYYRDSREDPFAGAPRVKKEKVEELRVVYFDPKNGNRLTVLKEGGTGKHSLVLQFRTEGNESFASFQ